MLSILLLTGRGSSYSVTGELMLGLQPGIGHESLVLNVLRAKDLSDQFIDLTKKRGNVAIIFKTLNFLEDICYFCGATVPLFLTSGDVCAGFPSQIGFPCLHTCRLRARNSPDFTLAAHY